ncbi:HNH endonuclease [Natrinema halophilum]|uniref:HNH endonuclease n=1 Tax=Natrinema halophilum TaxID=1699371 RepID=A0A7D5GJT0_9EURY|nr:HNH endonuclease [Natrinema halophilum]QLG50894.1 HNH endonuclease [Natrinema halophilum]
MTSPDRYGDREFIFERDAFSCRHCGVVDDDLTSLRTYPVGNIPLEGDVHESGVVTVCTECLAPLENSPSTEPDATDDLFHLVRETTQVQGATISDVADFASVATSLPDTLEAAVDDETPADLETPVAEYQRARRDVLLALDIVDARLDRLATLESAVDPTVRSALAAFSETSTQLQRTLREVVAASETVATGHGRCHGCFASLEEAEDETCSTCGLVAHQTVDWEQDDGTLAFDRLFETINETLRGASQTTETLTDRTMVLAEQLVEE